jgi:carbonic anhydrase
MHLLLLLGCSLLENIKEPIDPSDDSSSDQVCELPTEHPHDSSKAPWSYHGELDGQALWGSLTGYASCGTGTAQSPVDLTAADVETGGPPLEFVNYDMEIPLELLNNGHTLQVDYNGTLAATDPHIIYDGKTWYLAQFHGHVSSEHTVNGLSSPMELHFVHKATDGSLAVVGLLLDQGDSNPAVASMLEYDPGTDMELSCDVDLSLNIVPTTSSFLHYSGSLTTPDCAEGVSWFVLDQHGSVATEQADIWQATFGGSTNRSTQPLNGRALLHHP